MRLTKCSAEAAAQKERGMCVTLIMLLHLPFVPFAHDCALSGLHNLQTMSTGPQSFCTSVMCVLR